MEDQYKSVSSNKRFKTDSNANKLQHLPQRNATHHFYFERDITCDKMTECFEANGPFYSCGLSTLAFE